jgi:low affinity Fe/Cu permease
MVTVHLKLSELILSLKRVESKFAALDNLTDEVLQRLHDECNAQAQRASESLQSRRGSSFDRCLMWSFGAACQPDR